MPTKTTREVEAVFTAKDATTQVVNKISASVGGLGKSIDGAMASMASMGGLIAAGAGVFGLGASVAGAKEYLGQIQKVTDLTGMSANNAAALTDTMERFGLAATDSEGVLIAMAQKSSELSANTEELSKATKRYGVDLSQGPVKVLAEMSKQVQKGNVGLGDVATLLGATGPAAAPLMKMLKEGPEAFAKNMEAAGKKNEHINTASLKSFDRTGMALKRVQQAWTRISSIVVLKLAPVVEKMAIGMEQRLDGWIDGAQRFGDFMVQNMSTIIGMAQTFGKIMLANSLLMKTTGTGLLGTAGRRGKFAIGGGGAAATAGAVAPGIGAFGQLMLKLAPLFRAFARLIPIAAVVMAIVAGIKLILNNIDGARERLTALIGGISEEAHKLGQQLAGFFADDSPLGQIARTLGSGLVRSFEFVLMAVKGIVFSFRVIAKMIDALMKGELLGPAEAAERLGDIKQREDLIRIQEQGRIKRQLAGFEKFGGDVGAGERERFRFLQEEARGLGVKIPEAIANKFAERMVSGAPGGRPQLNQDFRGSRFEITQRFAEGFDPDRIAVAFSNDLGAIGERRLQSGLTPIGAIR
jgi:hypothetical protein